MTGQTQAFFHHYRAMDTCVLLARYRSGGLLPDLKGTWLIKSGRPKTGSPFRREVSLLRFPVPFVPGAVP